MSAVTPTAGLVAGVQALCEAVRATATNPADQVRLMINLAEYEPTVSTGIGTLGAERLAVQQATAAMCRRAALSSLARACAAYVPVSYNDAIGLLLQVVPLYDEEIETASDAGDIASAQALQTLRTAVINQLSAEGVRLPEVLQLMFPAPVNALALAYRLYNDTSRALQIVIRNDGSPHPGFLSGPVEVLSS